MWGGKEGGDPASFLDWVWGQPWGQVMLTGVSTFQPLTDP